MIPRYNILTRLFAALALIIATSATYAQVTLPHYDGLNYATGGIGLQSQVDWTRLNNGDSLVIASPSLSYAGLPASTGNRVTFDGIGIDAGKSFTSQTSGTVYFSFLLNVTSLGSLGTTGGYFTGFIQTNATNTNYGATTWLRANGSGFDIGLNARTTAANTVWSSTPYSLNTTYLVVIAYQIVAGASNDVVRLWINPATGGSEPAPLLSATNTGTDFTTTAGTGVGAILIRQATNASETPFVEMDELRIGTTWADVTPAGATAPIANTGTPAAGNVFQGTSNHVFSTFTISPTVAINFTDVKITTAGSATTSDVSNFRIFYDANGNGIIDGAEASVSGAGQALANTINFTITGQTGFSTARRYLVVGDVAAGATPGRTLTTSVAASTDYNTTGTEGGTALGNTQTIVAPPSIVLSANAVAAFNPPHGFTDRVIFSPVLTVSNSTARLTKVVFTTAGTYTAADLTDIKLWYQNNSSTLNTGTATLLGTRTGAGIGPGSQTFNFSLNLPVGVGNLFVTASAPCSAVPTRTLQVSALAVGDLVVDAPATVSGSAAAGGVQTISAAIPDVITGLTATPANQSVILNWANPVSGCWNEVMVVARLASAPTGSPSGDGSLYTANPTYGFGTAFGGGFVVYKGSGTSATVGGLTNGSTYHFSVWTRNVTVWSSPAVTITAVPNPQSSATDYFRSKAGSGNWNTVATWESSPDNTNWINATLVPTTTATAIQISNGSTVNILSAVTIAKTTIVDGGTLVLRNDGDITQLGRITFANGTGAELTIQSGGVFQQVISDATVAFNYGSLINYQTSGNIAVESGGIIRSGDGTAAHVGTNYSAFAHGPASQVSWANGAIYDWFSTSVQAPATAGVTYFPGAGAGVSPILRLSATTTGTFGASTNTTVQGIVEVNSNNTLTGTGTKTIRDGIRGSATLTITSPVTLSTSTSLIGGTVHLQIGTGGTLTLSQGTNIPLGADVRISTTQTNYSINKQNGIFNVLGTVDMTLVQISNTNGSVSIGATGRLKTARPNGFYGVTTATGSTITTGTIALAVGSTIEWNAAGNQVVNNLAAAGSYYNIVLSNSGTKTPSNAFVPQAGGTITIQDNAIFDCTSRNIGDDNTNLTMTGNSRLIVGTTGTNPAAGGTYSLTGGTVQFANSSLTEQTIRTKSYFNIEVTGTNVKNSNGNITLNAGGRFTVKTGGIFEINADGIVGPTDSQTLVVESAGTFRVGKQNGFSGTALTVVRNDIETVQLDAGSTVSYMRAGDQTITNAHPYHHLALLGSGTKTAPSGTLEVRGDFNRFLGTFFDHNSGTVLMSNATTTQRLWNENGAEPFSFHNLTINNSSATGLRMFDRIDIYNTLTLGPASRLDINSSLYVTLKSTATGTARLAPVPDDAVIVQPATGSTVATWVVERYFPGRRAWRLITTPMAVHSSKSIFQAWQIGGANTPGSGTYVSGPGANLATNGMDPSPLNNSSLKVFNPLTSGFVDLLNTRTNLISGVNAASETPDNRSFFMFIRGDRTPLNVNAFYAYGSVLPTTLRDTGRIQIKRMAYTANNVGGRYTLVGNPYPSPVDFAQLELNNVHNRFWAWDPNLNQVGGYVLLDAAASPAYNPVKVPLSSTGTIQQTQQIQSKQAIFVETIANGAASVVFRESYKTDQNNLGIFRPAGVDAPTLGVNLHLRDGADITAADGVVAQFAPEFNDGFDGQDGIKFGNVHETMGWVAGGQFVALNRRKPVADKDTLFLRINRMARRDYRFEILPLHFDAPRLNAWLEDTHTKTLHPIRRSGSTNVDFTVDATTSSNNSNRFRIVFRYMARFLRVQASMQQRDALVEWTTGGEFRLQRFEIERSTDKNLFESIASREATGFNTGELTYRYTDLNLRPGKYYYRIKGVGLSGEDVYSDIVEVEMLPIPSGILVYPNPVSESTINLHLNDVEPGRYSARLLNANGQVVQQFVLQQTGMIQRHTLTPATKLAAGTYRLEVLGAGSRKVISILVK